MKIADIPDTSPLQETRRGIWGHPGRLRIRWDLTKGGLNEAHVEVRDIGSTLSVAMTFLRHGESGYEKLFNFLSYAPGMLASVPSVRDSLTAVDRDLYLRSVCTLLAGDPDAKSLPGGFTRPVWDAGELYPFFRLWVRRNG